MGMKFGMQSRRDDEEIRTEELARAARAKRDDALEHYPARPRRPLPRGVKVALAGLAVLFIGGSAASALFFRHKASEIIDSQALTLRQGITDLQEFNLSGAQQEFAALGVGPFSSSSSITEILMSLFRGMGGTLQSFTDISGQLSALTQEVGNLQPDAFAFISGVQGNRLVADLTAIRQTLGSIDADSSQVSGALSIFSTSGVLDGGSYLSLRAQIKSAENFLDAFVPWLSDASTTHHILVLFENPSEMRPGGGFIGSYADVSLRDGTIQGVSVHDVADADVAFAPNLVPPAPLQLEGARWRPADGNWFFDFPTSASATIQLFEQSGLYATTTFDAAIAVTPKAVSDLLAVTGPISIAHPSTTFTSENLSAQIQKIVQAGQATSATYPKDVLRELSAALFARLASSTPAEQQELLHDAADLISSKDVMAYFKDPRIESFVQAYGAGGEIDHLPQNFNGDYFALANADINSDKSEFSMAQKVDYTATIGADGTLSDHVTVTRTHNGAKSPYWWYRTTNQDYLQIFVPDSSVLDYASGGIAKRIPAPVNYAQKGYLTDPLLLAITSTTRQSFSYPNVSLHDESGRKVYAVWLRTYAGATTQATLDYSHALFTPPSPGVQYQFVFERQSGAAGEYHIEIDAPLGYMFAENSLASFIYDATSTPGRLVFNLTLAKL